MNESLSILKIVKSWFLAEAYLIVFLFDMRQLMRHRMSIYARLQDKNSGICLKFIKGY